MSKESPKTKESKESSRSLAYQARIYIYTKSYCLFCKHIKKHLPEIIENFKSINHYVTLISIEDSEEFSAHDFHFGPVLILPLRRPIEGVNPAILIDKYLFIRLIRGDLTELEMKHAKYKHEEQEGGLLNDGNPRKTSRDKAIAQSEEYNYN